MSTPPRTADIVPIRTLSYATDPIEKRRTPSTAMSSRTKESSAPPTPERVVPSSEPPVGDALFEKITARWQEALADPDSDNQARHGYIFESEDDAQKRDLGPRLRLSLLRYAVGKHASEFYRHYKISKDKRYHFGDLPTCVGIDEDRREYHRLQIGKNRSGSSYHSLRHALTDAWNGDEQPRSPHEMMHSLFCGSNAPQHFLDWIRGGMTNAASTPRIGADGDVFLADVKQRPEFSLYTEGREALLEAIESYLNDHSERMILRA